MNRWLGIAILAIVAQAPGVAVAQSRGDIELGLDGGMGMTIYEHRTFITVGIPAQDLRFGWFVTDRVEMEPSIAYQRIDTRTETTELISFPPYRYQLRGESIEWAGSAQLALSYHVGEPGAPGRAFVTGGGLLQFSKGSTSLLGAEVGGGWKQRIDPHWALRAGLTVGRIFKSGAGAWLPEIRFGFSHI